MSTHAVTTTSPAGTVDIINSSKDYTHAIYVRDVVQYGESAPWKLIRHTTKESLALKQANTYRNVVGYQNVAIVPVS